MTSLTGPEAVALVFEYFPALNDTQRQQFTQLYDLYNDWNNQINLISRKDFEHFYERHVLHSLSIALLHPLDHYRQLADIGTGGGFPGIPLAILYPEIQFTLIDSIAKKLKVVQAVATALDLKNVKVLNGRAESFQLETEAVLSRAVAPLEELYSWVKQPLICLKGGDLDQEITALLNRYPGISVKEKSLFKALPYPFFETKKLLIVNKL